MLNQDEATPGPWQSKVFKRGWIVSDDDDMTIVTFPFKEDGPNTRLIAAAPELLEALQYCLEAANAHKVKALHSGKLHEIVQEKARAAIAKARGQA